MERIICVFWQGSEALKTLRPLRKSFLGKQCPVCSSIVLRDVHAYINRLYKYNVGNIFFNLKIYICSNCGFGFANPYVEKKDLTLFYRNIYRSQSGSHAHQLHDFSFYSKYGLRALSQFQLARTFWKQPQVSPKILDVGPGRGASLLVAKNLFPKASLFAIEPDGNSHEHLTKMGVTTYGFMFEQNNISKVKEKFDLILCSHVIEHYNANDLNLFLDDIQKILAKDGYVIFEVPYEGINGPFDNKQNVAPHLSFFTVQSFSILLQKKFEVLFCDSCGPTYKANSQPDQKQMKKAAFSLKEKLYPNKEWVKKKLENTNNSFIKKMYNNVNKLRAPDFFQIVGSDMYSYGSGRVLIRAVAVHKK